MSEGQRRAALLLHSVAAVDRQWVLQQLPIADRDDLEKLIDEAAALGLQSDPVFVEQALGSVQATTTVPGTADLEAQVRAASTSSMVRILQNEPAETTAMLCAAHNWPWKNDVLRSFGESKRRVVEVLVTRASVPPRLYAALLHGVCARLSAPSDEPRSVNVTQSVLHKLGTRVLQRVRKAVA